MIFFLAVCIGITCFASSASAAVAKPDVESMATYYRSAYTKIDITDLVDRSFRSNTYEWTPAQYSINDR